MYNENSPLTVIIIVAVVFAALIGSVFGATQFIDWNNNRNHTLGRGDATIEQVNKDARKVFELPDRFSNVAMFCDEYGNSVYVTTKSDYSRGLFAVKDGCDKKQ